VTVSAILATFVVASATLAASPTFVTVSAILAISGAISAT